MPDPSHGLLRVKIGVMGGTRNVWPPDLTPTGARVSIERLRLVLGVDPQMRLDSP